MIHNDDVALHLLSTPTGVIVLGSMVLFHFCTQGIEYYWPNYATAFFLHLWLYTGCFLLFTFLKGGFCSHLYRGYNDISSAV